MGLMEREYMREDYKKESSCKRWNGKAERKRNYIDSINFDSLSINKDIEPRLIYNLKKQILISKKNVLKDIILYGHLRSFLLLDLYSSLLLIFALTIQLFFNVMH